MRRAITIILAATILSCASARNKKVAKFKELTKDVCRDNPHEVRLAQTLYIEIVRN